MRLKSTALFILFATVTAVAQANSDLDGFRWDHRIIMVFVGDGNPEPAREVLGSVQAGILDRDILWFAIPDDGIATNYEGALDPGLSGNLIDKYWSGRSDASRVVLVGKDGGVKYRSDRLEPEIIFGRIDQMPMRRAEMRRKSGDQ